MASSSNPLATGAAIDSSDVDVPAEGGPLKAHLARPSGGAAGPAVVVIHENRGLQPYLRDVADGLAGAGYIAVAPDLLTREGGTASIADIPPVLSEIPRERHTADALACIDYLKGLGATKIGIIGFCFGGGVVWRTSVASADLAAAVPFYGANPPLEEVSNIKAAVHAAYGAKDERINAGIADINAALSAAGVTAEHKIYDDAGHAFHNHTNPPERYNAAAAKEAWADALAFFDKHLK